MVDMGASKFVKTPETPETPETSGTSKNYRMLSTVSKIIEMNEMNAAKTAANGGSSFVPAVAGAIPGVEVKKSKEVQDAGHSALPPGYVPPSP